MGTRHQRYFLWAVFALALLGVGFGWLWMIQGLVESENEIAQNEILMKEERLLRQIVNQRQEEYPSGFDDALRTFASSDSKASADIASVAVGKDFDEREYIKLDINTRLTIDRRTSRMANFALSDIPYSGYWSSWENKESLVENEAKAFSTIEKYNQIVKAWPVAEVDRVEIIQKLPWGDVVEGRDQLGVLILKFLREGGNAELIKAKLEEGVWSYRQDPINPGFRLLLIKSLESVAPSDKLSRLKLAETIRSVEGDVSQLPMKLQASSLMGDTYYYTKEQLERTYNEKVSLTSEPPEDRASVRVDGYKYWPYLSFVPNANSEESAMSQSSKAVLQVGIVTGIAALFLIFLGILVGKREFQRARARTDLAASVAHELRTPLAGQRVILETLQKNREYDDDYLSMALRENERLGDLAEEFLTFSRLERGVLEVQLKPMKLSELIEPVVKGFREHWDEELSCEIDDTIAMADEAAVATIVRNLLENAWKYSDEPREISISTVSNESEAGFSVRDNGIGLSKSDQARIFRQFYRVDQRLSRSREGLGIGLSIVRRLVEALDGRLEVESELGKGSTFTVYLKKGGAA